LDTGERFYPGKESGVALVEVLAGLLDPDGRYAGLGCRIHDDLKSIPVANTDLHPCAGLTNILDALAYEVHGMWFWSGPARIDMVSRPYDLFMGDG